MVGKMLRFHDALSKQDQYAALLPTRFGRWMQRVWCEDIGTKKRQVYMYKRSIQVWHQDYSS